MTNMTRILIVTALLCAPASAQVPQWFSTHTHPRYPASDYIIGVGTGGGANGAESARKGALADIAAQLRVQVQSEMRTVTQSFAVNDDEQVYSDFRRQSRTMVSDEITGAEVVETAADPSSGTAYALVALDRERYSASLRGELESGWKQAADLRKAAGEFFAAGRPAEAVQSIAQVRQVIAPLLAKQVLHNAAAKAPFVFPAAFNPAALQADVRKFLSSLTVEKKGGDRQRGTIGEKLPKPFVVVVSANGVPCAGVTVQFLLDGKTPLAEVATGIDGSAQYVATAQNGTGIRARASIAGLGREFEENLNASAAQFTWTAAASDKAFSLSVTAADTRTGEAVLAKVSAAVSQIGYKVVTMSKHALQIDVTNGPVSTIDGMAGTLYNLTMNVTVSRRDNTAKATVGSVQFSAKGVGASEADAMRKAAAGLRIGTAELTELLQR